MKMSSHQRQIQHPWDLGMSFCLVANNCLDEECSEFAEWFPLGTRKVRVLPRLSAHFEQSTIH